MQETNVHVWFLMDACHDKHTELNSLIDQKIYKGRVVCRGDQVRDEIGFMSFSQNNQPMLHSRVR